MLSHDDEFAAIHTGSAHNEAITRRRPTLHSVTSSGPKKKGVGMATRESWRVLFNAVALRDEYGTQTRRACERADTRQQKNTIEKEKKVIAGPSPSAAAPLLQPQLYVYTRGSVAGCRPES